MAASTEIRNKGSPLGAERDNRVETNVEANINHNKLLKFACSAQMV